MKRHGNGERGYVVDTVGVRPFSVFDGDGKWVGSCPTRKSARLYARDRLRIPDAAQPVWVVEIVGGRARRMDAVACVEYAVTTQETSAEYGFSGMLASVGHR